MPSHANSSVYLVVMMSCDLMLQICPIIALSFRCRCWRVGFVSGQVSLAWSIALRTWAIHAATYLEKRWQEEKTGSSSLNFFQAVFTRGWKFTASGFWEHDSYVAKGIYHLQLLRSNLDVPLWSAIQGACSSLTPCTSVIRVLCQALEPTTFLMHPVLAVVAEDAVAAHSSVTDSAWKLTWTLQEVQACTTDHDLYLSCIYTQSFLLHCSFPSQEPPDTFLKWLSDDNKVIGIEVLPGDPRVELVWQDFKHNVEEQRAEYWALVNTNLHLKLFTRNMDIPHTIRTIHSSTPSFFRAHQMTLWETRLNAFSRSRKAM